jgi:hypothetical protein
MPADDAGRVAQMHHLWFSSAKGHDNKLLLCKHLVMATEMHRMLV